MAFKKINLNECIDRLPDSYKNRKNKKTYLEECLENDTAEFYLIDNKYEFFFYKNDKVADLCIDEKSKDSIFDNEEIMMNIFDFLKIKGYKIITISLLKDKFINRHKRALQYDFDIKQNIVINDYEIIIYEKVL